MLPMILLGGLMLFTWGAAVWATFNEEEHVSTPVDTKHFKHAA